MEQVNYIRLEEFCRFKKEIRDSFAAKRWYFFHFTR